MLESETNKIEGVIIPQEDVDLLEKTKGMDSDLSIVPVGYPSIPGKNTTAKLPNTATGFSKTGEFRSRSGKILPPKKPF